MAYHNSAFEEMQTLDYATMASNNCQVTIPKQSICCPWTSRAPLAAAPSLRSNTKSNNGGRLSQSSKSCQHDVINAGPSIHQINYQQSTAMPFPSIQQSSNLFFNFLRFMQLFPDIHPATLHTTLVLCKNNFFCAVDKLLYAKRCKAAYNEQKQFIQKTSTAKLDHRHHPYSAPKQSDRYNVRLSNVVNEQSTPLDVSVKNFSIQMNDNVSERDNNCKTKCNETKSLVTNKKVEKKAGGLYPLVVSQSLMSQVS
ncbi:hypothetical protein FQR65_LT08488 [Abscondita terminalis]|nr:hypothetical protein FQR65_LT08488 [Abscondita terminalis]